MGASLIDWLPEQIKHAEQLAVQCKARQGKTIWIEDKSSGAILIQQCRKLDLTVIPLPEKFVSIGKQERAIIASPYVLGQQVKFSKHAYDKITVLKDSAKNHLMSQITNFRIGIDSGSDDALDTMTYSVLLTLHKDQ